MKKPVIGLVPLYDLDQDSYWMLPGYLRGIEQAGGIPVILPPRGDREELAELLNLVDGLLFTGGQDIDPSLYGQKPGESCGTVCEERDKLETVLLPLAMERDLPILAICRGIQLLNAVLGGTLWQDLPTERPSGISHRVNGTEGDLAHSVRLLPGTPIADLLGTGMLCVNSHHHQAIRDLAPSLRAMAESEDGLIEAVYHPDHRFLWAVQWHPEMMPARPESRAIFTAFLRAAEQ